MTSPAPTLGASFSQGLEGIACSQQRIVEEFQLLDEWTDRYQYLIEIGRRLKPMPLDLRTEQNRVKNCRGQVWLASECRADRLYFAAASDTDIVAGLLAVVVDVYSGHYPEDILREPLRVFDRAGLIELSPHRRATLSQITEHLRRLAAGTSQPRRLAS